MRQTNVLLRVLVGAVALALMGVGCGLTQGLFSPAFINASSGGVFPLTPGPVAPFVFVRVVNGTTQPVTFTVTIERAVLRLNPDGTPVVDDFGNASTEEVTETVELQTGINPPGNELGVVFSCRDSPVNRVGLGEDLDDPGSSAIFVGGEGAGGTQGFGISAAQVPPLAREAGQFNCGDTIIFRAYLSTGAVGGVRLESRLLPGSEQPEQFAGPSTFENLEQLLEAEVRED